MLDIFCLFFTSYNLNLFFLTRYFFPGEHAEDHFIWHLIYWPVQSYVFLQAASSRTVHHLFRFSFLSFRKFVMFSLTVQLLLSTSPWVDSV